MNEITSCKNIDERTSKNRGLRLDKGAIIEISLSFNKFKWIRETVIKNNTLMMGISETVRVTRDGAESFFDQTERKLFIRE